MTVGSEKHRKVLAKQLAMNRQTWLKLQELGVSEGSELDLDIFCLCPNEQRANELAASLKQKTDYKVDAHPTSGRLPWSKTWSVTGTKTGSKVSPEILDN
jgi:hypothetical protein